MQWPSLRATLGSRIFQCFASLVLLTAAVSLVTVYLSREAKHSIETASTQVLVHVHHIESARVLLERIRHDIDAAILRQDADPSAALQTLDLQSMRFFDLLADLPTAEAELSDLRDGVIRTYQACYVLAKKTLAAAFGSPLRTEYRLAFLERQTSLADQLETYLLARSGQAEAALVEARQYFGFLSILSAIVAAVALCLTALLFWYVSRRIAKPITELALAADQIERGTLTLPRISRGGKEVHRLTAAFQAMAQRVSAREKEARLHQQRLETTVAERTEELRRLNETLEQQVAERTRELERAKRDLEQDIRARERAEARSAQLERELRRSQTLEAMGRLAGGVAHDFNNLLGSILGCIYTARLSAPDRSEIQAELDRARDLCKRGGDLTRQLLNVARRGGGRKQAIRPALLLEDLAVLVRRTLPAAIRLQTRIDPDLPQLRGDPTHLHTAVLNLVLNARDAMSGGGTVTLEAQLAGTTDGHGEDLVIAVSDTGPGVPNDLQDRVFEPFFTTKGPGRGTGLGLSLVHATAQELGGEAQLDFSTEQGARFTLRLPVHPEGLEPQGAAAPPALAPAAAAGCVLVIEDEDDVAQMMIEGLERAGFSVAHAETGVRGLELLQQFRERVTLVVLDLALPDVEAETVYRIVSGVLPEVNLLFTSGRDDLAKEVDPTMPLLRKPFTAAELVDAVHGLLAEGGHPGGDDPAGASRQAWSVQRTSFL